MNTQTKVLIVGGGPVGMITALELARYGIASTVVERNTTTTRHPKMDLTNARSMEILKRLGILDDIREAGVAANNPFDISWVTRLNGHELHRFHYPSANAFKDKIRRNNDGTQPAEEPLRVSQIAIEPVLKSHIDKNPLIDVNFGVMFERIVNQTNDNVISEVSNSHTGEKQTIESQFLIGCDGGGSRVRRELDITLQGEPDVASAFMVHFHSTDTELLQRFGVTWHYQNGEGTLIAQNDIDTWTLQAWLPPGDDGSTWQADDVLTRWIGKDFKYEILQANPWSAHFVVAEKYNHGRVLLAGDAAHQYIPTGGYGMNSGVADACGVAWTVAAHLQGWGGQGLFEAYDQERRNTAWWHLNASKKHMSVRISIGEEYQKAGDIYSDTKEAQKNRDVLAKAIEIYGNGENESWGIELGYRYESDIIFNEKNAPNINPLINTASTWPGCRLPHLFLDNGQSIHEKLGLYFTLICFGETADIPPTAETSLPLEVLYIDEPLANKIYQYRYILVRPDQHIAWRGNVIPNNFFQILKKVTGN